MTKILKYSVLRYVPSVLSGEKMNLGIVFSSEEKCEFKHTKNYSRLEKFDDELNIDSVKKMFAGMSFDVSSTLLNDKPFDIEKFVRFYINAFSFDKVISIEYDDYETTIEELFKFYFRFDYKKKDRPSERDDTKLFTKMIDLSGTTYEKNVVLQGDCFDSVKYDFVTEKHCIKLFDFDDKNLSRSINNVKAWAWNCSHSSDDRKKMIVYRYSDDSLENDEKFTVIKELFNKAGAEFCNIDSLDAASGF